MQSSSLRIYSLFAIFTGDNCPIPRSERHSSCRDDAAQLLATTMAKQPDGHVQCAQTHPSRPLSAPSAELEPFAHNRALPPRVHEPTELELSVRHSTVGRPRHPARPSRLRSDTAHPSTHSAPHLKMVTFSATASPPPPRLP
ncbi:hypothetical protein B0T16DRAFT_126503 [Cercophora newfieldiana]|uniref:Uncharacterized protein n=1 Tax=Cercophora newfieldiana TaxID=92897 RepID=A0AA39YCX3_9PEZI|nr:hypothetical protein B0T16DRAFT_126503 [Cercophora newfieldiana]